MDSYMKVMKPGVWLVLGAVILLLAAVILWAVTGRIETTLDVTAQVSDGWTAVEISKEEAGELTVGSEVRTKAADGQVTALTWTEDTCLVEAEIPGAADGVTEMTLVTERIAPIRFLTE